MKIKNLIVKSLVSLLATALLMCGCFFVKENKIINETYAETNIPSTFIVNGHLYESIVTNNYGETFKIPEWLYNQRFNTLMNNMTFSEVYNQWYNIVSSGTLVSNNLSQLENLYKISNNYLPAEIGKTVGGALGQTVAGAGTSNTSKVLKFWLGWIAVQTINTIIVNGIINLGKNVWNSLVKTEPNIENNYNQWEDLGPKGNFSTAKDYYNYSSGNNNYNTGTSTVQPIYNTETNKIYDVTNNNQHYVSNYSYDYSNNIYDYSTDDNIQFLLSNETKYVEMQKIVNGVSEQYRQYYRLPNGDNSYNLTDDQIHGYKLDFNVQKYNATYDYNDLKTLYHFNGDLNDSSITNSTYNYSNGNNFAYINEIWDTGLVINHKTNAIQWISTLPTDHYFYNSFRFMPSMYKNFYFYIQYRNTNNELVNFNIQKQIQMETQWENKYQNIITNEENPKQIVMISGTSQDNATYQCRNTYNGEILGAPYANDTRYEVPCAIPIGDTIQSTTGFTQYQATTSENITYNNDLAKAIDFENWNTFKYYKTSDNKIKIKINNTEYTLSDASIDNTLIQIGFNSDSYIIIDEMVSFRSNTYKERNYNYYLPFDTNLVYTIPNNIEFSNNLILLKTKQNINSWQIGGKRSSSPSNNDVYFSVDENGIITSVQQYNAGNWISIDGAIYSENAGKFVSIIGYSIIAGDEQYVDLGTEESQNWLSTKLNEITESIKSGFNSINEKLDTLINGAKEDKEKINELIQNVNESQNQLDQENVIDSFNDVQPEMTNLTSLAKSTSQIVNVINDNGLSIIYVAPLIVLLIRMVI